MNKQIWYDQKKFNKQFFKDQRLDLDKLSIKEQVKWAKEFHFHISRELSDLLNCLPEWKMHYKKQITGKIIHSNIREEFIDVLKYLMGLGQVLGISYSNIICTYRDKTEVVQQKYEQNKLLQKFRKRKVIIFDIDGVINNYPICLFEWAKKKFGIKYKVGDDLRNKVDLKTYNEIKESYRLSGEKRNLPVNEGIVSVMRKLKGRGETLILYTIRPILKYKRIFSDTLYWLKKNRIPFDAIFWSDYHKEDIYELGMKIKFIVDDDRRNAMLFNHEGYKVFLINNSYNQGYRHNLTKRIFEPLEILRYYDKKKKNVKKIK